MHTNKKILPNFIIAGAPKCGTSSVFSWLSDHPEVCGSQPKETFYLIDREHPTYKLGQSYNGENLEGYDNYFQHCNSSAKIFFEATTHYIYQNITIEILSKLNSQPQILFILRKPEDRVYSYFQYYLNNKAKLKVDLTFTEYVHLIKNESLETFTQNYCTDKSSGYILYHNINHSCYVNYLEKWKSALPDRIHILLFEDMLKDRRNFMKQISNICDIDSNFFDNYTFPHKNATYGIKNRQIHRWSYAIADFFKDSPFKEQIKRLYLKLQSRKIEQKNANDLDTIKELAQYFISFNHKLSTMFDLDLSIWQKNRLSI
ncbi:sulfotransferase domain-containing protein [Cyanobacterium aponinum]|uniref:sulfotransferase domain-containing protein n=1 Tax=Cyanobacterium aponinum TaxID=379064 RepID=UPI0012BAAFFD